MNYGTTSGGFADGAENPIDQDLYHHTDRVAAHGSIPPFVSPNGVVDPVALPRDGRRSFQREPAGAIDLADRRPSNPFDVAHLLRVVRRDDADDTPFEVDRERDGDRVEGAISTKSRQGGKMPIGEKPTIGRVELVQGSSHDPSGYRGFA